MTLKSALDIYEHQEMYSSITGWLRYSVVFQMILIAFHFVFFNILQLKIKIYDDKATIVFL